MLNCMIKPLQWYYVGLVSGGKVRMLYSPTFSWTSRWGTMNKWVEDDYSALDAMDKHLNLDWRGSYIKTAK